MIAMEEALNLSEQVTQVGDRMIVSSRADYVSTEPAAGAGTHGLLVSMNMSAGQMRRLHDGLGEALDRI